ncbi:transmembrane protein [Ditylenchus destructor]|uniref:Transmembrane protein n=1 Tax=Ditylenchus destructor TaxID=166010 RepID=A0AAD4MVG4_9BILA|nr:transmembrane protein [Ditylenchus destructor]
MRPSKCLSQLYSLSRKIIHNISLRAIYTWILQTLANSFVLVVFLCIARWLIPTLGANQLYYHSNNPFIQHLNRRLDYSNHDRWNEIRADWADSILATANFSRFKVPKSSKPRLVIAITASARQNKELTQVMAFLSAHLHTDYPIVICNTEVAGRRPEPIQRFENLVHIIDINMNMSTWTPGNKEDRWMKEAQDYWRCMSQALETLFNAEHRPDYLLVLEDDAVPIPLFDAAIRSVMNQLDFLTDIDYVKFYRKWSWRGGSAMYQSLMVALLLSYLLQTFLWNNRNILTIVSVWILIQYVWQFYFRQLISDARFQLTHKVMLTAMEGCCTPAVLYRTTRVPELLDAMWETTLGAVMPKDVILDKMTDFAGRISDFNLVVHIGYYSELNRAYKDPGN